MRMIRALGVNLPPGIGVIVVGDVLSFPYPSPWLHLLHLPYFHVCGPPLEHSPLSDWHASEGLDL